MQLGDFAAGANRHAVFLELCDQVLRHRLAQVGAPVQERHERAPTRERDRRLPRRVAATDHADALSGAELFVLWSGRIEHADALVVGQARRVGEVDDCRAKRSQLCS